MVTSRFLTWICRICGIGLAIVSLMMTYEFGLSISVPMAIALAVCSIMASYMWPIALEVRRNAPHIVPGRFARYLPIAGVALAVLLTVGDGVTNSSTQGVHRVHDVTEASFTTDNRGKLQEQLSDKRKSLELFRKRLNDLKWTGAVTHTALRSQIEVKEGQIAREAGRGGCGPKCEALTREKEQLVRQLGTAENHDSLTKQITATEAVIARLSRELKDTPPKVSSVDTQNVRLAAVGSLFTLSPTRNPGEGQVFWTDVAIMYFFGFLVTAASQFFNTIAWLPASGLVAAGAIGAAVSRETLRETPPVHPDIAKLVHKPEPQTTPQLQRQEFGAMTIAEAMARLKAA